MGMTRLNRWLAVAAIAVLGLASAARSDEMPDPREAAWKSYRAARERVWDCVRAQSLDGVERTAGEMVGFWDDFDPDMSSRFVSGVCSTVGSRWWPERHDADRLVSMLAMRELERREAFPPRVHMSLAAGLSAQWLRWHDDAPVGEELAALRGAYLRHFVDAIEAGYQELDPAWTPFNKPPERAPPPPGFAVGVRDRDIADPYVRAAYRLARSRHWRHRQWWDAEEGYRDVYRRQRRHLMWKIHTVASIEPPMSRARVARELKRLTHRGLADAILTFVFPPPGYRREP